MGKLTGKSKLFFKRNSSTLLTCVGAIGVVATGIMAVKATPKALKAVEEATEEKGEDLTKLETVKVAGPAYIPAVLVGASTIACIIGANVLDRKQQASLMSAYALLNNSYKEYKKKVVEMLGEDGEIEIRNEIAKDKYDETDIENEDDGMELFYDEFSGRYFRAKTVTVQRAAYEINRDIITQDCATINDYYRYLGIPEVEGGDEIGWSSCMNFDSYWQIWVDFGYRKVTMDDGLECWIITIFNEPYEAFEEY